MKLNKLLLGSAIASVLAFGAIGSASAATYSMSTTASVPVQMTITDQCSLLSTVNPSGTTSGTDPQTNQSMEGDLLIKCTPGTAYQITFNNGLNAGKDTAYTLDASAPAASDGAATPHYIAYQLVDYTGPASPPGTTTYTGSAPVPYTATASATAGTTGDSFLYYASFYDLNLAPAGVYNDTLIATLSWN